MIITTQQNQTAPTSAQVFAQHLANCEMSPQDIYNTVYELLQFSEIEDHRFYKHGLIILNAAVKAMEVED